MKCDRCGTEHTTVGCSINFDNEAKVMAMEFDKETSMGKRVYRIRQALHRAYRLGKFDAVKFTPLDGGARTQPLPPMTFEVEGD